MPLNPPGYYPSEYRQHSPARGGSRLRPDHRNAVPPRGPTGQNTSPPIYYDRERLRQMKQRFVEIMKDAIRVGEGLKWKTQHVLDWQNDAEAIENFSTKKPAEFLAFVTKVRKRFLYELEVNLKDEIKRAGNRGDRSTSQAFSNWLERTREEYSRIEQFGIYDAYKLTFGVQQSDTERVYEGESIRSAQYADERRASGRGREETYRGGSRGIYDSHSGHVSSGSGKRRPPKPVSGLRYESPGRNISESYQRTPLVDEEDVTSLELEQNLEIQKMFAQDMKETTAFIEINTYKDWTGTTSYWKKDRRLLEDLRTSSRSFVSEARKVRWRFLCSLQDVLEDEIKSGRSGGRILDDFKTRLERVEKEKQAMEDNEDIIKSFRAIHLHDQSSSRAFENHYERQGTSSDTPRYKGSGTTRYEQTQDGLAESLNVNYVKFMEQCIAVIKKSGTEVPGAWKKQLNRLKGAEPEYKALASIIKPFLGSFSIKAVEKLKKQRYNTELYDINRDAERLLRDLNSYNGKDEPPRARLRQGR